VEEFWPDLVPGRDLVLEPSCGRGAFLKAIPRAVEAVGVEIDPLFAAEAAANTGRRVICGDFRTVELDVKPTLIVGNPPYKMRTLDAFLDRACGLLPDNGRCGFLLSSYMLQTPNTVLRWNERWSLEQRMVPRTLFPRSIRPLMFVLFTKDRQRKLLGGFLLYKEAAAINRVERESKLLMDRGEPGKLCWGEVAEWTLKRLGGRATVGHHDAIRGKPADRQPVQSEEIRRLFGDETKRNPDACGVRGNFDYIRIQEPQPPTECLRRGLCLFSRVEPPTRILLPVLRCVGAITDTTAATLDLHASDPAPASASCMMLVLRVPAGVGDPKVVAAVIKRVAIPMVSLFTISV
jgi:site-specific DNA-methyltransferase (adenine-specific)